MPWIHRLHNYVASLVLGNPSLIYPLFKRKWSRQPISDISHPNFLNPTLNGSNKSQRFWLSKDHGCSKECSDAFGVGVKGSRACRPIDMHLVNVNIKAWLFAMFCSQLDRVWRHPLWQFKTYVVINHWTRLESLAIRELNKVNLRIYVKFAHLRIKSWSDRLIQRIV